MLPLLAAVALAAAPGSDLEDEPPAEEEPRARVALALWGGGATLLDPGRGMSPFVGAEVGWLFSESALSLLWEQHRYGVGQASRTWTQVAVLRLEQHFETRRGAEGTMTFGLGAGRPDRSWTLWYQFAVGFRLVGDPFFLKGEIGFERANYVRLAASLGAVF
ncbi:MAG TPA: hypothetical protein VH880_12080 [Anaeromyxobacteraceae bacterium]